MNIKSISRAFTSNLGGIVISPTEQAALAAEGISEPTIQRYVLWRRATILMVVIGTALSAGVSTFNKITEEDQPTLVDSISDSVSQLIEKYTPSVKSLTQPFLEKVIPSEEKPEKGEKPETPEPAEKPEKPEKPESSSEKPDGNAKAESSEKTESSNEAAESPQAAENSEKADSTEKADDTDKAEKTEKTDKAEATDKADKAEKAESDEKAGKNDEVEKAAKDADSEKDEEGEEIKAMGRLADGLQLISLYILPVAAIIILLLGNRFRLSFRIMVIAFAFSFFAPMLMALCPWSWWGVVTPDVSPSKNPILFIKDQAEGAGEALGMLVSLLPSVLSLIPGVQKACLRVKTLLPQALLPGWFIVVASPLYGLFLLVIVVAVDQFTGELAIIIPLALLSAASLTYAFRANDFTRPYLTEADFRRAKTTQRVIGLMTALAGLILVYFLATRQVFGIHAVGTDPKTSVMRPMDVVEFIVEVIGRSMFVSALGAEFIMRMSITAWRHNRDLTASESVTAYDEAMDASGTVLAPEAAK